MNRGGSCFVGEHAAFANDAKTFYGDVIANGLKVQPALAMLMPVMAEVYGTSSGLGYFIINHTNYGNYTNVAVGIIMAGIVMTILDSLAGVLVRVTVKWSE